MESPKKSKSSRTSVILVIIVVCSLFSVGLLGYFIGYSAPLKKINDLQNQITTLEEQISSLESLTQNTTEIENVQNQITSLEEQFSSLESLTQNTTEIEKIQNHLSIIQEQIGDLQSNLTLSYQNTTLVLAEIEDLKGQVSLLQQKVNNFQAPQPITNQNITYIIYDNVSLSQLFDQVRESVVVVQAIITQYDFFGRPYSTQVQGSGFVYRVNGEIVILTNYHVISSSTDIKVTFTTGNDYAASILGSDPLKDLAVISTEAPETEYSPLVTVSSSTLRVGDPVIVVGTPYGLAGSMSDGIVSALNRTLITEEYSITNVIQTTAPINPGNSGGPLLNYHGQVIGMVTAIIQDSQGIGFAIPSDTILEGIEDIIIN